MQGEGKLSGIWVELRSEVKGKYDKHENNK